MTTKAIGDDFELDVQSALEAMGYATDRDVDIAGCQIDILATKRLDLEDRIYVVECKNLSGSVGVNRIRNFKSVVDATIRQYPGCTGMFVCREKFTKGAKSYAESVGLILKTIDELNEATFKSDELAKFTVNEFKEFEASKVYVDLSCQTGEFTAGTVYKPVEKFLNDFLPSTKRPGCAILGDFGSGKTSLSYSYAAKLANDWISRPNKGFLPIVVRLRYLDNFTKLKSKILDEINEKVSSEVSARSFEKALETTRFLFVLDGLDEIATRWDQDALVLNLAHLEKFMKQAPKSRFLLTCRTHFFRTRIDEQLLGGLVRLYVRPWGQDELNEYVTKRNPKSASETIETIKTTYNLEELSKTPIFLKMITETIGEFHGQIDHAQLYRVYTDKWINEQLTRSSMSSSEKRGMMEAIALHMMVSESLTVSHDVELPALVSKYFGLKDYTLVRKLDQDIRTCSFLVRDEHGDYFFVHKSYMEYFVGCVIAKEIQSGCLDRLRTRDFGVEVGGFVACFFKNDWKSVARILRNNNNIHTQLNVVSIARNLESNSKFESIVTAILHTDEDMRVRSRVLECLAHWATETSISTVVEIALDNQEEAQRTAVTLLAPLMDRAEVGDKLSALLQSETFNPICADVIESAIELRTKALETQIQEFAFKSFWKTDRRTVFSVLKYIQEVPSPKLIERANTVLGYAESFSVVDARISANAIFFKVRGSIAQHIQKLQASKASYREIEGKIRSAYGRIVDDQDISGMINASSRSANSTRDQKLKARDKRKIENS